MAPRARYLGYNQSKAPKPPDYSIPEAVTMRAFEASGNSWALAFCRLLKQDGKCYRDFIAACARPLGNVS